jgi:hypothetical protein
MGQRIKNPLPGALRLGLLFATKVSYRYCFGLMTPNEDDANGSMNGNDGYGKDAQNLVAQHGLLGLPAAAGFQ